MAILQRRPGRRLPFRIPMFRIFYSTTYTTIYMICLCLLAITPVSMIWSAIQNSAYQYTIMIGASYVFTGTTAMFLYSSRLYTNRTVLAGVGKSYVPIEEGELGKNVRKMIVAQLERSAVVAWESRPRDLFGEVMRAERLGLLPVPTRSSGGEAPDETNGYTVGSEIPIDPAYPPWGEVQHAGWSSPSQKEDTDMPPETQFSDVIKELPNLIEARAVSLAPVDRATKAPHGSEVADAVVVDVLRRPETMGMREYLTQLSSLGLVNPSEVGQRFQLLYERARFGGLPSRQDEFKALMSAFAELLSGMNELDSAIIEQIHEQTDEKALDMDMDEINPELLRSDFQPLDLPHTPVSSLISPVTARTAPSRSITPYTQPRTPSEESLGSVLHLTPTDESRTQEVGDNRPTTQDSESLGSVSSDTGSVVRRSPSPLADFG